MKKCVRWKHLTPLKDAQDIETDNAAIQSTQMIEYNEKVMNHYLLDKMAQDDFEFTEAEKTEIMSIAMQCPLAGGRSVFLAQGIYRMIDNSTIFDNTEICDAAGYSRKAHETPTVYQLSYIKPNPSSEKAVLVYNNINENILKVIIYNAMNEVIYTSTLNATQFEHSFEVGDFNNGIYFYTIVNAEKIISSGRFAVIR